MLENVALLYIFLHESQDAQHNQSWQEKLFLKTMYLILFLLIQHGVERIFVRQIPILIQAYNK